MDDPTAMASARPYRERAPLFCGYASGDTSSLRSRIVERTLIPLTKSYSSMLRCTPVLNNYPTPDLPFIHTIFFIHEQTHLHQHVKTPNQHLNVYKS